MSVMAIDGYVSVADFYKSMAAKDSEIIHLAKDLEQARSLAIDDAVKVVREMQARRDSFHIGGVLDKLVSSLEGLKGSTTEREGG